jgi:hypothetical protein
MSQRTLTSTSCSSRTSPSPVPRTHPHEAQRQQHNGHTVGANAPSVPARDHAPLMRLRLGAAAPRPPFLPGAARAGIGGAAAATTGCSAGAWVAANALATCCSSASIGGGWIGYFCRHREAQRQRQQRQGNSLCRHGGLLAVAAPNTACTVGTAVPECRELPLVGTAVPTAVRAPSSDTACALLGRPC